MELLVGLVVTLLGGLVFFKRKADKAEVDAKLAEVRGRDAALKEQQEELEAAIRTLDNGIEAMKKTRELEARKRAEDNLTLKERADRIKKRLK
jgi:predicted  nucleic acid-binding Zn-ribbon protein